MWMPSSMIIVNDKAFPYCKTVFYIQYLETVCLLLVMSFNKMIKKNSNNKNEKKSKP